MSYRHQYSGSPWQQRGAPFAVGGYNQNYGGYNDQYGVYHQMMNAGYNRIQGGYGGGGGGGMYGESGMRNMGYSGPSSSRHYMNDRMSGRQISRGQMKRKRLPQRSPASGPQSKRPKPESDRRLAKPRRRRESWGGSKNRHDRSEEEEDDDTYNTEEPTDDVSDVDYDTVEWWKSPEEDGKGEEEKVTKENGEQESTDAQENSEKESEEDDGKPKKPLICYVCKVTCSTKERLTKHQNSKSCTGKIEKLLRIRREKKKGVVVEEKMNKESTDKKAEKKKSNRKPGNWCTVCECAFPRNFLTHRRTKGHRKKRDRKYPKCLPCKLGFSSSEEYRDHCTSDEHKQRSAEFHYLKNLASGSDEDEAALEPVKVEDDKSEDEKVEEVSEEKAEAKGDETATESEDEDKSEVVKTDDKAKEEKKDEKNDKEKKEVKKSKPKEPKCVGQSFVASVQGYYCKLCHKFFKVATDAKSKHCRSIMHTEAFKKAMGEAIEQEKERQKVAEEHGKQDKETAEAEGLAADIAAIERAAKEAAKKELATKKAGASKDEDVEMKDFSEDAKGDFTKDAKDESANKVGMEIGVKDDMKDDMDDAEEAKHSTKENKCKESEAAKEEQADEEQEEFKEEITSPATTSNS